MDTQSRVLRNAVTETLTLIEIQIMEVKAEALKREIRPETLRYPDGNWAMSSLLLAKAQALHTLALLNTREKS